MSAEQVVIEPAPTRVTVRYSGEHYTAPHGLQREIDRHWAERLRSGASLTRGPIFHVTSVTTRDGELCFDTALTDYAHYVHTIDGGQSECRVLYTSALLRTRDGVYLVGEMAPHTSTPGRLQCAGGGLAPVDFHDGVADLASNIRTEIDEETGISAAQITRLEPAYVKSGGEHGFFALVFVAELTVDGSQVLEQFERRFGGTLAEFSALVRIPAQPEPVRRFFEDDSRPRVDYLERLLTTDVTRVQSR